MNLLKTAERLMAMDDASWARHANPWSVWTRFSCLPLLVSAVWSRVWLGWWSLLPIGLALAWIWYNPRAFAPPDLTDNWASKVTFGERVFLNRQELPIPAHHVRAARVLTAMILPGVIVLVFGLIVLDVWAVLFGLVVSIGAKAWFADRMVWLYEDMKDADPTYASWLKRA